MQLKNKAEVSACEVELEVEVGAEDVSRAVNEAYREFGEVTEIPGFRKGKAPREILARYVSEERLKKRVAEELVPDALADAVKEAGIEPFAQPDIEIMNVEDKAPLVFKASVPLPPKTELGNYVGIEVDRLIPVVTDEQVQQQIDEMRERTSTYEPVEGRPVQQGDRVLLQMVNESDPEDQPDRRSVIVGENLPSFDEGLLGMNVGEEKVIEIVYPEDFSTSELAGKTAPIRTNVLEVNERKLPELDDEWAKTVGSRMGKETESLEQLKDQIRVEMERTAAESADRQVESKIVQEIMDSSNVCYPEVLRDHEVMHRLQDMVRELERLGSTLEEYLARSDRTPEQLREELEKVVDQDLKVMLVLSEIAEKENIQVEDEDIAQEIKREAEARGVPVESYQAYVDKTNARDAIAERLFRRKILDFLVHASNIKSIGQPS